MMLMVTSLILWWGKNAFCTESSVCAAGFGLMGIGGIGYFTFDRLEVFFVNMFFVGIVICIGLAWYCVISYGGSFLMQLFLYSWLTMATCFIISIVAELMNL